MSGDEALARARALVPERRSTSLRSSEILGMRLDATSYGDAVARVLDWAKRGESRAVYLANVHMVMEAYDRAAFRAIVNAADLVTPDGMPLVWMLRRLINPEQTRVYGPDLMLAVCATFAREHLSVGFFGGKPETLAQLKAFLAREFPSLRVSYAHAPPFRPLSESEIDEVAREVRASDTRVLFVGLGCPKQETWIFENKHRFSCPVLGIGAAIDFHAGLVRQAPTILQRAGLEWMFRLLMEPRRLWRRYAYNNPRFVALALRQLIVAGGTR